MPIRKFNYTGRKRIKRNDINIVLEIRDHGPPFFNADIDLTHERYSDLPADSPVFVEAKSGWTRMRFPFGTVAENQPCDDRFLGEFDTWHGIRFRLKVVKESDPHGLLLAQAEGIRPEIPDEKTDNRTPLLAVKPSDGIGDELYRLDFHDDDHAILLVNKRVGEWERLVTSREFISLAFPMIIRETLTWILRLEEYDILDDPEDWKSDWLTFASELTGSKTLPSVDDASEVENWVDDVVGVFCKNKEIFQHFQSFWDREEES